MALYVQKFGGTSVGDPDRIREVADHVARYRKRGDQVVLVVSAMGKETDELLRLAEQVSTTKPGREMDMLITGGERKACALVSMALHDRGIESDSFTGSQAGFLTDTTHRNAKILDVNPYRIQEALDAGRVPVVGGSQGVSTGHDVTFFGRGGSDTTAVALAAALKAEECQIYTDVDGVYTTDPRVVDGARRLKHITFEEMLEMASMGSKVLQIRAVEFAGKYQVPLRVLHSFQDGPGTLITIEDDSDMETPTIAGIAFNRDEAKLTIEGVPDMPGVAYHILGPIGEANIEVDVIVQNVSHDNTTDFTFTVSRNDLDRAEEVLNNVAKEINARKVTSDNKIAKVSVVGVGMRSHAGVASQMFAALAEVGLNIQMITTSEIKISVIIEEKFLELAVRSLHSSFELEKEPEDETAA